MSRTIIAALLVGLAGPAWAQTAPTHRGARAIDGPALAQAAQEPGVDQRIAPQAIAALQALVNLREAELRAAMQDFREKTAEREKAWAEYAKPLWGTDAPVAQTTPAPN